MKSKMKTSSIQLPIEVWEFLERGAKAEGNSVSALIRKYITYGLKNMVSERVKNTSIDSLSKAPLGFISELINYLTIAGHTEFVTSTDREQMERTRKSLMHFFIDNPETYEEALNNIKYISLIYDDVALIKLWSDNL